VPEIKRYIEDYVIEKLKPGKVNVIHGARRVGKTHLLKQISAKTGYKSVWLNGDLPEDYEFLASFNLNNFRSITAGQELLVIDEAQNVPGIGKILKVMVDEIPHVRILASGSSAFDLSNELGEPLVGRAHWHQLFGLAQIELAQVENRITARRRLDEKLIFGSYPELYFMESESDKKEYLNELVNSYLLKDILAFDGVRNSAKILDLLKLIAFQVGKEVSFQELGKQLGMSKNTVERYLDLLEKVFVLKNIRGFSRNLRKEVTKTSRWFFWDNGIRNALIGDFKPLTLRNDTGALWENYVITELIKKGSYRHEFAGYYFWRTYDQQEIDLLEEKEGKLTAFEIKWNKGKTKIPVAFAENYPDSDFQVIDRENYMEFIS
jgi:predicted AAA+ superfamily ATPase